MRDESANLELLARNQHRFRAGVENYLYQHQLIH